jgi:hypothetical protein
MSKPHMELPGVPGVLDSRRRGREDEDGESHHRLRLSAKSMSHGGRRWTGRAARINMQIFGSRRIIATQIRGVCVTIWIAENNQDPSKGVLCKYLDRGE